MMDEIIITEKDLVAAIHKLGDMSRHKHVDVYLYPSQWKWLCKHTDLLKICLLQWGSQRAKRILLLRSLPFEEPSDS